MSNALIFVLVLCTNAILWSRGRYGQYHSASLDNAGQSLPYSHSCPSSETFLSINYLRHYFCADPSVRPAIFVALILWAFFLFSTLGISASDFFTPNLATIAQLLGLDENVAGVTFLAFGNGSPDMFSTFSAMRTGSGSLAIGELLGAASFIVSCVVGSMCIISPFKVHPKPFVRDVGFFTSAVLLIIVILWDGEIRHWEAASLIGLYLIYVLTVVLGSWWDRRQERRKQIESLMRDDPTPTSSQQASLAPPGHNLPPLPHIMPSFSLIGAIEFREVVAGLRNSAAGSSLNMFESPVTPYAGGHYHSHPTSRTRTPRTSLTSHDVEEWDAAFNDVPLDERSRPMSDYFGEAPRQSRDHTPVPSIFRTPASPTASESATSEIQRYSPPTRWRRMLHTLYQIYHTLFPTFHRFKEQSILGQIACIFAAPAVLMLTLTLPVVVTRYNCNHSSREKHLSHAEGRLVDFEEEGVERILVAEEEVEDGMHELTFNKWLMAVQCVLGPLFCAKILFGGSLYELWVILAILVSGIAVGTLVAIFAQKGDHPTAQMVRCSMGFFVAIVWIMAIADEVVNVLQTFGFIFGLSDAIIGLTIFAVGNSLADLVANMSVAVFAPIMGFSACFGGPMLNILLGVGVSGTYIIQQQSSNPYLLELSTTLFVSAIGLLVLLVSTLVIVPLNGFYLTRKWGVLLIVSYVTIMTVNVIVEIRSE
ncbi:Sodium/calcium exchanger protein-domain-containing protein [Cyathus striatus]|nr:Sodium/calcium exchanger protein-domain-containing protein [Cyathus striatus]